MLCWFTTPIRQLDISTTNPSVGVHVHQLCVNTNWGTTLLIHRCIFDDIPIIFSFNLIKISSCWLLKSLKSPLHPILCCLNDVKCPKIDQKCSWLNPCIYLIYLLLQWPSFLSSSPIFFPGEIPKNLVAPPNATRRVAWCRAKYRDGSAASSMQATNGDQKSVWRWINNGYIWMKN